MLARNEALEAAIIAAPADPQPYAVYGDWLLEQGDPYGELVSVQTKLALGEDRALREREGELLALEGPGWLGAFADAAEVDWEHGFVRRLRLGALDSNGWRVLRARPALAFLRELVIDGNGPRGTVIAELGFPPCLAALTVAGELRWDDGGAFQQVKRSALRRLAIRSDVGRILRNASGLAGLGTLRLLSPPSGEDRARIAAALPGVKLVAG